MYLRSYNYVLISVCSLYTSYSLTGTWYQSTIFVDCDKGNDSSYCGNTERFPCLTLRFAIYKGAQNINSSHVAVSIAPGVCKEKDVLRLDCSKTAVKSWAFIGFNQLPRAVIVEISAIIRGCSITFSSLQWKNSKDFISFNTLTSDIKFENSLLQDSYIQFTGLNTNLAILNTSVNNCTSGDKDVPLFSLQMMYGYQVVLFIDNSTFSNNPTPVLHATQLHDISVKNTICFKNGQSSNSTNGSVLTISASSILLQDLKFNQSLWTAINVMDVTNFTARNLEFSSNNGSRGSCLVIHRHSNISLTHSFFTFNTNPVIYIGEKSNVDIIVKKCYFDCDLPEKQRNMPFIQAPEGINISFVNCSKKQSCFVHCKSGELLKSGLFCQKCPAGSFSFSQKDNISSSICQSCPVGMYTTTTASTNCTVCPKGTYAEYLGSKKCMNCPNEFFISHAGAESCSEFTLEFILALAVSIPLIIMPLVILIGRHIRDKKSKGEHITSSNQYRKFATVIQ